MRIIAFARTVGFIAGELLLYSLPVSLLSGGCLAWYYIPVPDRAVVALDHLKESVFAGGVVLSVHILSGAIFICAAIVFAFSSLTFSVRRPTKAALIAVAAALAAVGILGLLTGSVLAQNERAGVLLQRLFSALSGQGPSLPPLFDAPSLLFFRVFLIHAAAIPAAAAGLLCLLSKSGTVSFGRENRDPVIKRSAWFAAYTAVLIIAGCCFKSFFLNR